MDFRPSETLTQRRGAAAHALLCCLAYVSVAPQGRVVAPGSEPFCCLTLDRVGL
jgi:hypothetical protein